MDNDNQNQKHNPPLQSISQPTVVNTPPNLPQNTPPTPVQATSGLKEDMVVVNGVASKVDVTTTVDLNKAHSNKTIYLIGFVMRIVGLLGVGYVLGVSLFAGPIFFLILIVYWEILLPSLLVLAVGHYLAKSWKP